MNEEWWKKLIQVLIVAAIVGGASALRSLENHLVRMDATLNQITKQQERLTTFVIEAHLSKDTGDG